MPATPEADAVGRGEGEISLPLERDIQRIAGLRDRPGCEIARLGHVPREGDRPAAGPRQWLGDALGIGAAVLWGLTTLVLRGSRLSTAAPEKTLLWQLAVSGLLLTAAAPLAGESWPAVLTAKSLLPLAFQTVIVSFVSYLVWFWLLRHYPATQAASFTLLTPIFGLFAGAWILSEPVTARLLVALATVAGGIALVNRR